MNDSSELSFSVDGRRIPYRIRVSSRSSRVSLRFGDDGLEIVRPERLRAPFAPQDLLRRFSRWILRQADRRARRTEGRATTPGAFLLRGVETPVPAGQSAEDLRRWLFEEARRDLTMAMTRRSVEMDQPFGRIAVRDQRWLWGSCSPASGTVSLNARLVMAPPAVLDYIVVHELSHFRWRGHGARFWDRVGRFCPDWKTHRRWLRENAWRLKFPEPVPGLPLELPGLVLFP